SHDTARTRGRCFRCWPWSVEPTIWPEDWSAPATAIASTAPRLSKQDSSRVSPNQRRTVIIVSRSARGRERYVAPGRGRRRAFALWAPCLVIWRRQAREDRSRPPQRRGQHADHASAARSEGWRRAAALRARRRGPWAPVAAAMKADECDLSGCSER